MEELFEDEGSENTQKNISYFTVSLNSCTALKLKSFNEESRMKGGINITAVVVLLLEELQLPKN